MWLVATLLHLLLWLTPPQLAFTRLPEDRRDCFTEWYVFAALIASVLIYYLAPSLAWLAWLSTCISASTLVVMLHIVLLQRIFGPIKSPERSLLLFMFNAAQIVVMFGIWYRLCGQPAPLLKSILTFATIEYANKMPRLAIVQIATDFVLLAIFLGFFVRSVWSEEWGQMKAGDFMSTSSLVSWDFKKSPAAFLVSRDLRAP